jgi:hypothetical protein
MKNTGGPAFPQSNDRVVAAKSIEHSQGMTLRDYFATKAMQVLVNENYFDVTAKLAYKMADAMLEEREK